MSRSHGPWTSHGHIIPGQAVPAGAERPKAARCGGPGLCAQCAGEVLDFAASMPDKPVFAKTYDLKARGQQPTIDGTPIPWHIAESGPRVECIESAFPVHILWVPVLIDAPLPEYAHEPPGDPVSNGAGTPEPILTSEQWDKLIKAEEATRGPREEQP